jgi:hypothetical protein
MLWKLIGIDVELIVGWVDCTCWPLWARGPFTMAVEGGAHKVVTESPVRPGMMCDEPVCEIDDVEGMSRRSGYGWFIDVLLWREGHGDMPKTRNRVTVAL